ncbi:MAG TPA: 16S rRNA (uracil(1498)-N(3))-methyltransferase [Thermohalobaculum sp.]|nr:16S rRNA (uracil(1498)-N(3))-methyltransferase [Thermohalobaculum sp.]
MAQPSAKIRLFVGAPLGAEADLALSREQAHYLFSVMRLREGAPVLVFNGRDGEWLARVAEGDRRGGTLACREPTRPQSEPPDLWLAFAPVKKARTDFIVEKATELGCRRIVPVLTRHTQAERVNTARLRAHAVEAAEQSGRLTVPEVAGPVTLAGLLGGAQEAAPRRVLFCDESGAGQPALAALDGAAPGPWTVLIGPEGGFDGDERARLAAHPHAVAVSLGPRILRADTAAVAALALWQAALGDSR